MKDFKGYDLNVGDKVRYRHFGTVEATVVSAYDYGQACAIVVEHPDGEREIITPHLVVKLRVRKA